MPTPTDPGPGCWFCNKVDGGRMFFSCEWDCDVHVKCLLKAYMHRDPDPRGNVEVDTIAIEFGLRPYDT